MQQSTNVRLCVTGHCACTSTMKTGERFLVLLSVQLEVLDKHLLGPKLSERTVPCVVGHKKINCVWLLKQELINCMSPKL